ncbi:MAG TPA: protease modulator HflC [Rickettsiales bacterium]|nr:protease modulator HflC [Rickettsiales bacterium]
MRFNPTPVIILIVAALVLLYNSLYVVEQTETALVTQFGKPVAIELHPGLKFKMPFVQTVEYFDNRLLEYYMPDEIEINASDEKRIKLEAFLRWRIVDPLAFARATRAAGIGGNRVSAMNQQLANLLGSSLRQAIGSVPLSDLLSPKRDQIMQQIRDMVSKQTYSSHEDDSNSTKEQGGFGIKIVDVRIVKADLPPENSEAVFKRMQADRKREATTYRAQGDEEAQTIRAEAERQRTVILADAQKQAEITRGEGDAQAAKISADAYSKDPEFYDFYRSMQAYARSMTPKDTTFVLSPESRFLRQFSKPESR